MLSNTTIKKKYILKTFGRSIGMLAKKFDLNPKWTPIWVSLKVQKRQLKHNNESKYAMMHFRADACITGQN